MLINVDILSRKIYNKHLHEFVNADGEDNIYKYETVFVLAIFFITGFITITDIVILNAYYRTKHKEYDLIELTKKYVQLVHNDTEIQESMKKLYQIKTLNLNQNEVYSFYNRFVNILKQFSSSLHLRTSPQCLFTNRMNPSFWNVNRLIHVRLLELIFTCLGGYDIEPIRVIGSDSPIVQDRLKYLYTKLLLKCAPKSLSETDLRTLLSYCPRNTHEYNTIQLMLMAS